LAERTSQLTTSQERENEENIARGNKITVIYKNGKTKLVWAVATGEKKSLSEIDAGGKNKIRTLTCHIDVSNAELPLSTDVVISDVAGACEFVPS